MLLSPGHSPREIPPTQTLTAAENPPPTAKRRRAAVLDEDTYVAAIEKIVERDFFPDIPKLRDRLDWLQAVRTHDPLLIRDAQLKILERRSTPSVHRSSDPTPTPSLRDPAVDLAKAEETDVSADVDVSVPLDEFFRRYTSEDNESFARIMEKVNWKRKEKYAHLLGSDGGDEPVRRITDGYGSSDQPTSTLEGWNYDPKNLLMYNAGEREEAVLTVDERAERLKGMTKVISRANTRFHGRSGGESGDAGKTDAAILYKSVPSSTPIGGAAWPFADREAEKARRYDLEDLRKTPLGNAFFVESSKNAENGYSFVKTPSPAPGVDGSPLMTWGEIEGTPLRLDLEDTPVGSGDGPRFSIASAPSRDVKAHSLSRDAARKIRDRSKMFRKPPLPSPSRSGSMTPSARTLSPAAQKFVRSAFAKSSHSVDETLRASYRGNSPVVGTPKSHMGSTRFGKEASLASRSPSARNDSPW